MSESDDDAPEEKKPAKIGIPIPAKEFHALAADYVRRMKKEEAFEADDFITMTRIFNTITHSRFPKSDKVYEEFAAAFFPAYVERIARLLGAVPTKGMALYSRTYDLYVGGPVHEHSQYHVEKKQK